MIASILNALPADFPWKRSIQYFPTIDSTNTRAKLLAAQGAPHGTVLIAGHQSGGRGRMGRSFHSPEGMGIYLSVILRPNCPATDLMHLTCAAGVAMCDAVEAAAGFRPGIKWTNDLIWGKHKLGGILTELSLKHDGTVDYAVVGIGINCCQQPEDFPQEIRGIAASLSMASGKPVAPADLAAAMVVQLERMAETLFDGTWISRYAADCVTVGKEISIVRGDTVRHGTAIGVDPEGALTVRFPDGHEEAIASGEVSVRGMYGYV